MSTEMGFSCQPSRHWAATNHLSGRGLVQPIMSSVAGRCAGRGCALIRQLANSVHYTRNQLIMGLHGDSNLSLSLQHLSPSPCPSPDYGTHAINFPLSPHVYEHSASHSEMTENKYNLKVYNFVKWNICCLTP